MPQIHGQITTRLPADSDRWTYHRDEETTDAVADEGYRLGTRWATVRRRSGRRTFWLDFATTLINITAPSMALWLLLLVTQAERLLYIAHTVVILP